MRQEGPQPPPVGGRLAQFAQEWESLTEDQWVLDTVRIGCRIDFTGAPPPDSGVRSTPIPKQSALRNALEEEVHSLLAKAAIEDVPPSQIGQGFYSTFFVVPKKPQGFRPILNLKPFNHSVVRQGFKLDSVRSVRNELRPGDWAFSLDLKDAYYHIQVASAFRRYLRFSFQGRHFQFRALPFGLSSSPRTFCKCLAPILSWCHAKGIRTLAYLDDWLTLGQDKNALLAQQRCLLDLLQRLGWIVSYEKSELTPSQRFSFIGITFDTTANHMAPSEERINTLTNMAASLLANPQTTAMRLLEILGHMASTIDILSTARLHMRFLQLDLLRQWKPKKDPPSKVVLLGEASRSDLIWWSCHSNLQEGSLIWIPHPQATVITDASEWGWGAHYVDKTIQGQWTPQDRQHHINYLELKAVFLALQAWGPYLRRSRVLLRSDNSTVVQYINKQGGTRSPALCLLTRQVWDMCLAQGISITAAHFAGKDNTIADCLSRGKALPTSTEWSLHPQITKEVFKILGTPHINLFASRYNNKLPTFCSLRPDPEALASDALSLSWSGLWGYAFPPIPMVPRSLGHARRYPCRILMVAPRWERQPWFPTILEMLYQFPMELPVTKTMLRFDRTNLFHPDPAFLKLTVWPISGIESLCREFRDQLRSLCWHPGDPVPSESMLLNTGPSPAGVIEGVSIPVILLSTKC
jgi:hypothetical protein